MPSTSPASDWYRGWELACRYQEPEAAFQLRVVTGNDGVRLARAGDSLADIHPLSPDDTLGVCWTDADRAVFEHHNHAVISSSDLRKLREICGTGSTIDSFTRSEHGPDIPLTPDDLSFWDSISAGGGRTTSPLRQHLNNVAVAHFVSRSAATRPILEQRGRLWRCVNELTVVPFHSRAAGPTAELRKAAVDTVVSRSPAGDLPFSTPGTADIWFERLESELIDAGYTVTGAGPFRRAWAEYDNVGDVLIVTSDYHGCVALRCWPHHDQGLLTVAIAPRHVLHDDALHKNGTVCMPVPSTAHTRLALIAELCENNRPAHIADLELIVETVATLTPAGVGDTWPPHPLPPR
jgi:hypothetical protein